MNEEKTSVGKIIWLIIAAAVPAIALAFGIAGYWPHRDLYQKGTVIFSIGALVGVIKWFSLCVSEKRVKKGDVVAFVLLTVFILYVGYCQITLPICIDCDKPTFLNAWIWKLLEGRRPY